MSIRHLEHLFHPASIAVIGASDKPGSVGAVVWRNVRDGGFRGPMWAVNKRLGALPGEVTWANVAALPQAPELAIICTPAATVPELIDQLGRKGTRAAVVVSAGLKERPAEGQPTLEQQMLDAARPYLLRILGPNCIGLLVPALGLNASFAPDGAKPGKLAFVTQSGALATAMLDWANGRGIGFSHFISLGDSADVDSGDVLDWLGSDPGTRAILMYAESVKQGRKFMSAARAAARNKPVIVVKAGRAPEGARAAASHTGALAGSDMVFDAAARRAGMLRVPTLEALFDAAQTLAHPWSYRGERLAILTNGGGAGVLAADALSLGGGRLAALSDATLAALDACLPATWSRGDPIDIIGDAPAQRYVDALGVLLAAPEVDGVIFAHAPTAVVPASDIAGACLPLVSSAHKPVLGCWLGGPAVQPARDTWAAKRIPSFETPERAVQAWLQIVAHARNQRSLQQIPPAAADDVPIDRAAAQLLIDEAARTGQEWLDEVKAKALLQACGIPAVPTRKAHDAEEAAHLAAEIGFPVALKIMSPQILHKSDVGGVALNLGDEHEVRIAAMRMRQRAAREVPQAHVVGFAVEAMVRRTGGREVIVGVSNDPVFGPVILCGLGGTDVELLDRHAVALPPLNAPLADDLIARAGLKPLFAPSRGRPAIAVEALREVLLRISRMVCELQGIAELDVNPLVVDARGVLALDARVRVAVPRRASLAPLAICPYPAHLEERRRIGNATLDVRPIRPEDAPRLEAFYGSASSEDMRLRFFFSRPEVPRSELARYTQIDYDREMAFIALDAQGAMAAEVRAACDPDNEQAEFAIQVAHDWQGKGLGAALLCKMLDHLRARGTKEVVGYCLLENHAMAALARAVGMKATPGGGMLTLRLSLSQAGEPSQPALQCETVEAAA